MSPIGDHIKAVLFDYDDTLVGTFEAKFAQHKHIARKYYGKELTDDELMLHWGKPLNTLFQLLYDTDDPVTAKKHVMNHYEDFPKKILEDTIHVIDSLHEAGMRIGIITAGSKTTLAHDHKTMGFPVNKLDYIQTEEDTDFHKPDPRVFEPTIEWLTTIDIVPKEVIYVGDGLHDMKAALGAGFEFIGVPTGLVTQDEFHSNGAKSIKCLGDLVKLA